MLGSHRFAKRLPNLILSALKAAFVLKKLFYSVDLCEMRKLKTASGIMVTNISRKNEIIISKELCC